MGYRHAWLTAGLGVFRARLAGFEPATRCLEATANATRTARDVRFYGLMTRYRSGQAGTVATGIRYRLTLHKSIMENGQTHYKKPNLSYRTHIENYRYRIQG